MYKIITDFARPDPALVQRAAQTFFAVTGGEAGPRQVMDAGIKPLLREWRICGPAFTVRPEYTDDLTVGYAAGHLVKPGDVVVVDAGGRTDVACWGATMARGVREGGAVGIVLDGVCLTSETIIEREDIPVFCRGTVARSGDTTRPGWLNCPVICGGVIVNPGDIICGDADGIVVLPRERAEAIIAVSEQAGSRSRAGATSGIPFRQRNKTLDKLKAMKGVVIE